MVLLAAAGGLAVSLLVEWLLQPTPVSWRERVAGGLALHAGCWLLAHAVLTLLLGRPWFAMALVNAGWLLLVLVNNAKVHSLREPFVFADFEYFTDAIRHPRLYIPFLGWPKALAAALGFVLAVGAGLWLEAIPAARWALNGQAGGGVFVLFVGAALVARGGRCCSSVTFKPEDDIARLGLIGCLCCYGRAEQGALELESPLQQLAPVVVKSHELPHLVAIQSESFFDPRRCFPGIRPDVLATFDRFASSSRCHGGLTVPAWGANTVRTEFAFLTGVTETALGVHRFNPYRKAARSGVATLASVLRQLGYRTLCIHPYPAHFYARDRVYPALGFDEFIDIKGFEGAERAGPYISDCAVADKITEVLAMARGPVFVFAITMENHGPLHLESISAADISALYVQAPPPGCEDLTVYLRHLRNADRMLQRLQPVLVDAGRPMGLCWYGDHVPIMPGVYQALGDPGAMTDYFIWRSDRPEGEARRADLAVQCLAAAWLSDMGLFRKA